MRKRDCTTLCKIYKKKKIINTLGFIHCLTKHTAVLLLSGKEAKRDQLEKTFTSVSFKVCI